MFRALRSTSCQGERHGVGKGGEQRHEQRQERQGQAGGGGTRMGTAEGEAGASREGSGARVKKESVGRGCVGVLGSLRGGAVPIRSGTYNIRNGRNGGLESALRGMS